MDALLVKIYAALTLKVLRGEVSGHVIEHLSSGPIINRTVGVCLPNGVVVCARRYKEPGQQPHDSTDGYGSYFGYIADNVSTVQLDTRRHPDVIAFYEAVKGSLGYEGSPEKNVFDLVARTYASSCS